MSDIIKCLKNKNGFISLKGATVQEIKDAEAKLKTTFSDEYKEYLLTFGLAAWDGFEMTGLCKSKRLNVVDCTQRYREKNKSVPSDMYVIQIVEIDGIVVWQSTDGMVYETVNQSKPKRIAESIRDLLEDDKKKEEQENRL